MEEMQNAVMLGIRLNIIKKKKKKKMFFLMQKTKGFYMEYISFHYGWFPQKIPFMYYFAHDCKYQGCIHRGDRCDRGRT